MIHNKDFIKSYKVYKQLLPFKIFHGYNDEQGPYFISPIGLFKFFSHSKYILNDMSCTLYFENFIHIQITWGELVSIVLCFGVNNVVKYLTEAIHFLHEKKLYNFFTLHCGMALTTRDYVVYYDFEKKCWSYRKWLQIDIR